MNENPEEFADSQPNPKQAEPNLDTAGDIDVGDPVVPDSSVTSSSTEISSADDSSSDISKSPDESDIIEGDEVTVAAPPVNYAQHGFRPKDKPPVAVDLEGIAANGGAVGAMVLGIWSILGSLLTYWSMINGVMGLVLGVWGLTSKRPKMAMIGIALCIVGCFLSMMSISEIVSNYWKAAQDQL